MYILLIYRDPATWNRLTAAERGAVAREHDAFQRSVGELVLTEAFADPARTATVRVRDGDAVVTDGPYVRASAFVCGYYLIDCDDRGQAIELAARVPDARYAAVEVRELTYQFGTSFGPNRPRLRRRDERAVHADRPDRALLGGRMPPWCG